MAASGHLQPSNVTTFRDGLAHNSWGQDSKVTLHYIPCRRIVKQYCGTSAPRQTASGVSGELAVSFNQAKAPGVWGANSHAWGFVYSLSNVGSRVLTPAHGSCRALSWRSRLPSCSLGAPQEPGKAPPAKAKVAHLHAEKEIHVPLPLFCDSSGCPQPLSTFLRLPVGRHSMLNAKALRKMEQLDSNLFRCYLPSIDLFSIQVVPVIDLCVSCNDHECVVELLSCKFEGSEAIQRQNKRFAATLQNRLLWTTRSTGERTLTSRVRLDVSLEVFTLPFTMLPISAVEVPGSKILQAMLERLVPLFIEQLTEDYRRWARGEVSDTAAGGRAGVQYAATASTRGPGEQPAVNATHGGVGREITDPGYSAGPRTSVAEEMGHLPYGAVQINLEVKR